MTKQNNGWISVEERLPENDDYVLIVVSYPNPKERFIELAWLTKKSNDKNYFENLECEFDLDMVTHWQPLPQPPKDVKNE